MIKKNSIEENLASQKYLLYMCFLCVFFSNL